MRIVAAAQCVVLALWALSALTGLRDFNAFYQLVWAVGFPVACAAFALWTLLFRPAERRWALWTIAMPVGVLGVISGTTSIFGAPMVRGWSLVVGALVLAVLGVLVLPGRVERILPSGLTESRGFNGSILALLLAAIAGWIVPFVAAFGGAVGAAASESGLPIWVVRTWIWNTYLSVGVVLPALVYAYVNLPGGRGQALRRWFVAQALAAAGLLVLLVPVGMVRFGFIDRLV